MPSFCFSARGRKIHRNIKTKKKQTNSLFSLNLNIIVSNIYIYIKSVQIFRLIMTFIKNKSLSSEKKKLNLSRPFCVDIHHRIITSGVHGLSSFEKTNNGWGWCVLLICNADFTTLLQELAELKTWARCQPYKFCQVVKTVTYVVSPCIFPSGDLWISSIARPLSRNK